VKTKTRLKQNLTVKNSKNSFWGTKPPKTPLMMARFFWFTNSIFRLVLYTCVPKTHTHTHTHVWIGLNWIRLFPEIYSLRPR